MKHEKENKPVEAIFVKVLEDSPKGISQAELNRVVGTECGGEISNQAFKIPQGPTRIGNQWW